MDLEGFEPLTSRMRTERSPNSLAFVHTLCTARKEKSTCIRPYKNVLPSKRHFSVASMVSKLRIFEMMQFGV